MKKGKRLLSILMILILLFPSMTVPIEAEGISQEDWAYDFFGPNTSEDKNPAPTYNGDGSITLEASGGKISKDEEGISFYSKKVPAEANFEIKTSVKVDHFNQDKGISTPNQKSFGLMLKDAKGTNTSNYVAVGALDTVMKGFYKAEELGAEQIKLDPFENVQSPVAGEEYQLIIKKSGETYELVINGVKELIEVDHLFTDDIYVGFYVARDAKVTFKNTELKVDSRQVDNLEVDTSKMKKEYLLGEELDLSGLKVVAEYSDGQKEELSDDDYIVSGFNNKEIGTNKIVINYNGVTATIDLEIKALTVTDLTIKYSPVKTIYYKGDAFDPAGLVVEANYNDGYKIAELKEDQYKLSIEAGQILENPGEVEVIVTSTETENQTSKFNLNVLDVELEHLEIRRLPLKTQYFVGDDLDLAGISVYAIYDDGTEVRLKPNDFEVSGFDSEVVGDQEVLITHKDQSVVLNLNVKEPEVKGIEVTEYPKTTYEIGEEFNQEGMVVSKVYDNGDKEPLGNDDYHIDRSDYDHSVAGVYEIKIIPEEDLGPIVLKVTVREKTTAKWNEIRFGQSTSKERNTIEKLDDDVIRIAALDGAGKITGDHDGITFYYTEIDAKDNFTLSADIFVEEFARQEPDGQEAFGIMARDAIGIDNNAAVFASNMAALGGFNGGSRSDVGTVLFARSGVVSSDGEGSEGVQRIMLDNVRPNRENTAENYRLTLSKTNSGFTGQLNDGEEKIIFKPDILSVQDQDKIYVGFFAARLATIQVSNIELAVSDAATDAPAVLPEEDPITPHLDIISLDRTSDSEYTLMIDTNIDGVVTVKQGQDVILTDGMIKGGETLEIPTEINDNANTNFSIVFSPDDTQHLTDYDEIVKNFTVTMKTFGDRDQDIYVSPTGTSHGDGSKEKPLDLDTAIDFVQKGQKIIVQEGVYKRDTSLEIKRFNDGTEDARKYLIADPEASERPLIDFDKKAPGVIHGGDYWYVEGIDFTRAANGTGYGLGGSFNIINNISTFENGGTGFQISRVSGAQDEYSKWPAHNLVKNSISFDNMDPAENGADGFAAKLTVGDGNVFRGNVSHNNIDDGWDLYTKVGTGPIGAVTLENNISFNNGKLTNGHQGTAGQNGYKLGGEGVHVPHIVKNNLAFGNDVNGYTSNSNPGVITENNIGFNNGVNLSLTTYSHITPDFTINGFASIQTESGTKDTYQGDLDSDLNYMFDGSKSVNASGEELSDELLNSLENLFNYDDDGNIISVKRNKAGEIQWGDIWETYDQVVAKRPNEPDEPVEPGDPDDPSEPGEPGEPGEPAKPGESGESGESDDSGKPIESDESGKSNDSDKPSQSDKSDESSRQEGNKQLPSTATSTYTFLLIGLCVLAIGVILIYKHRQYSHRMKVK
ncbi:bacterial Ig-like domain-containing protein [Amphibacillus sp. MSJ-3]|uniref:bacterial Ig-like domain-containing protein n=1 Tax=Amphibacillus sp. MSJ-3 TaxID=2841505 RepID=UPI001C0EB910|nr:bacterial Ig-like domain-containing protein [Amphibacillus sp. MSJ-3]MBU5593780.1 bacterial Ig-like domain-containing protein [Amphibacillus sp. MSJ-3]